MIFQGNNLVLFIMQVLFKLFLLDRDLDVLLSLVDS